MPQKSDTPFSFKKAEDSPGFLLWQASQIWQRIIKAALEEYDISHSQFVIIASLMWFELHNIDTTQTTLINWTKLDKMTISKSLKKLATLKLVTRIEHEVDTRAKSVSLTNQGKNLITKLIPMVEGLDHEFFGQVTKTEQQSFIQILRKFTGAK